MTSKSPELRRPFVEALADAVEERLRANDHKNKNPIVHREYFIWKLLEEVTELVAGATEINNAPHDEIIQEAADVATVAWMLALSVTGEIPPWTRRPSMLIDAPEDADTVPKGEALGLAYELDNKQDEIDRLRARVAELEAVVEPARALYLWHTHTRPAGTLSESRRDELGKLCHALATALGAAEKGGAA